MSRFRMAALAASASITALSWGGGALAQTAAEPHASSIEEVVVTARRREESLQAVPLAVTAISGDELNRRDIRSGENLQHVTPSLSVASAFGQETGFVSIRGLGTTYSGTVANPGVTTYFAEVATPGGVVTPATYFDLQNVQVLKGPQGTLFGRNSLGGAVLFEPKRPGNEFEGFVQGVAGNYQRKEVEGAVTIPIIEDKLSVRLAGQVAKRDGYQKDYITGRTYSNRDYQSARATVLWRPTDDIENLFIASYLNSKNHGMGFVPYYVNMASLPGTYLLATTLLGQPVNLGTYLAQQNARGPYSVATNSKPGGGTKVWSVQDTLTFHLNDTLTLKNIASYSRMKQTFSREDYDGTPYPIFGQISTPKDFRFPLPGGGFTDTATPINSGGDFINQKSFTEELQLQASLLDGDLTFTSGVYYQKDKPVTYGLNLQQQFLLPSNVNGLTGTTLARTTASSKSVYSQGTLNLGALSDSLNKLKLTVGFRHTWDKVTGVANAFKFGTPDVFNLAFRTPLPAVGSCTYLPAPGDVYSGAPYDCITRVTQKGEANTWNVSLDYQITPEHLVYVATRRGYKAGGVNQSGPPVLRAYEPEQVTDVEAGFKGDWRIGDNISLRTNLAIYYARQKNIQRINSITYLGQTTAPVITGSTGDLYGGEFEFILQAYDRLTISGFYSHTHFKWDKLIDPFTVDAATGLARACRAGDPGFQFFDVRAGAQGVCESELDLKGVYTPLHKYSLSVRYAVLKSEEKGELSLNANYVYQTAQLSGIYSVGGSDYIKGYGLLNASVDWDHIMGSRVSASVFGTNLGDQNYAQGIFSTSVQLGFSTRTIGEPKMYGVRLRYEF
jgi:iron complex outermembrane receptor protein